MFFAASAMSSRNSTRRIVHVTIRMTPPGFPCYLAHGLRGALARGGLRFLGGRVDALAQLLARLEVRHVLLRHLHLLARLRIAAGARRPVVQPEAAEAADLDAVAGEQRLRHRIEDHLDRVLGVLRHQLRIALGEARDQFGLGHATLLPFFSVPTPLTATGYFPCRASPAAAHRGWLRRRSPRPARCGSASLRRSPRTGP